MSLIRLLHVLPLTGKASFGIGPVVLNMAAHQVDLGISPNIWSVDVPDEARKLEKTYGLASGLIRLFSVAGPRRLAYSPEMEKSIIAQQSDFDIVHQHGIWTATSRVTLKWRVRTGRPTVIVPHGSLSPWALNRSFWKKRIALAFYESDNLHQASCLQALSNREAMEFRDFGMHNPIAVIPNGISEAWLVSRGDGFTFRRRYGIPDTARVMLFLGRITPIKGLPMFLRAIARSREHLGDWILVVAGVNEFGHQRELESIVAKLALEPYVKFFGPQYDQDKIDAFKAADLFVLPSLSEGSPVAILEALGTGIPVLTTKATPWEDLLKYHCGWWVDISEQAMCDALKDVGQQPLTTLREMGQRGRDVVTKSYTWGQIGLKTLALYRWLLRGDPVPNFVMME